MEGKVLVVEYIFIKGVRIILGFQERRVRLTFNSCFPQL